MSKEPNSIEEAILSAIAAQAYQQAAVLIERQSEVWMRNGEVGAIDRALRSLPRGVSESRIGLSIWFSWVQTLIGEQEQAEHWVEQSEQLLRQQFPTPELSVGSALNTYQNTAGQIHAVRGLLAQRSGDRALAMSACQQALHLIPETNPALRTVARMTMTVAGFDLSSIDTALGELRLLRRAAFATEQPFVLLSLLMYEVDWLLTNGQVHGAFQIAKRALAHMQEEPNPALVAPAHLRLAQIAYLWNELADAQEHISAGLATAHPEFLLTTVDGYHTQARLYAAQGKWDLAYHTLAIAVQFARSGGRHAVCDRIAAWEARLRLVEGDSAAALRWAKQVGCWGLPLTDSLSYDQVLTCCRLLIVLADAEGIRQAEGALRRMLQAAAEKQRTVQRIEIGVLLTWLYSASGKAESAVAQLAEILALVETSGVVRVLLDDGIRIWAPLHRLALAGPLRSVALRIQHAITSSPVNAQQQAPYEALNSRELGILQLLAQGCTNTEIAHQQALAVSTVQWYLKHIYRKLDVHNRTQAAMRARDLSLLSSAFPQGRG